MSHYTIPIAGESIVRWIDEFVWCKLKSGSLQLSRCQSNWCFLLLGCNRSRIGFSVSKQVVSTLAAQL